MTGLSHLAWCSQVSSLLWRRISFVCKALLYVWSRLYLSVHLLVDACVTYTSWRLWEVLLWTSVHTYLLETLLSIPLGIRSKGELLDHMGILYLIFFWETAFLFSIVVTSFYIPNCIGVPMCHHLQHLFSVSFFSSSFKICASFRNHADKNY